MSGATVTEALDAAAAADQWYLFSEFCRWEAACGGPDPQLAMVQEMSRDLPLLESGWRIGCYGAVYNVPGAELLWQHFPVPELDLVKLQAWVDENFPRIPFRRERRAVRSRVKLARYLHSYGLWLNEMVDAYTRAYGYWVPSNGYKPPGKVWQVEDYDSAWKDMAQNVWGAGRYIIMKMLELFRRMWDMPELAQPDIRAQGGWSPRGTLAMLYPHDARYLLEDDTRNGAQNAEHQATNVRRRLYHDYGLTVSYYDLQVFLCEYRESYVSRRQYPGRSLDSELKHFKAAHLNYRLGTAMLDARARIFPHECLGEFQGWGGTREELGSLAAVHGYMWSDLKFDFTATTNFSRPVPR